MPGLVASSFAPGHPAIPNAGRIPAAEAAAHVRAAADQLILSGGLSGAMRWCRDQGWGAVHIRTVIERARALIASENAETLEQSRVRMCAWLESEIRDAENAIVVSKKGDPFVAKDRRAIAAYANLLVTLRGLNQSTVRHVNDSARPLRDLSTAELLEQEQVLAQAIADRAVPAEVLTGVEDPIPSTEKTVCDEPVAPEWWRDACAGGRTWLARAGNFGSPDGTSLPDDRL